MIIQLLLKKDTNYFKFPPLPLSECQQKAPGMMQKKKLRNKCIQKSLFCLNPLFMLLFP